MPAAVGPRPVFRNGFWRGVAIVWLPFLLFVIWDVARRGFPRDGITSLAVVGAVTVLVYAVGWRPVVVGEPDRVVVRNPFRTTTVPWNAVTSIDATDALRVHTQVAVVRAWAVDRGGAATNTFRGWNSRRLAAPGVEGQALSEMARRSPAEYAVATLTDLWRQRRGQTRGVPQVAWSWPTIGAFLALTAISIVLAVTS